MNDTPKVGLGVMILNDLGEVLLILRNSDAEKADSEMRLEGTWTLPAGKVKYNEKLFDAAKRKVLEEVNLKIDKLKIISVSDDINDYAHYLTIGIIAYDISGNINLGITEEHIQYKYFKLDELPSNLCEPSKKIINNYLIKKLY